MEEPEPKPKPLKRRKRRNPSLAKLEREYILKSILNISVERELNNLWLQKAFHDYNELSLALQLDGARLLKREHEKYVR